MSQRICIIGDSHMAALKLGWDAIASQYPGVECTFFGSAHKRGADMEDLHLQDGVLVPATADLAREIGRVSGGLVSLKLGDFDVIVVVGLQFGFATILSLIRRFRTHSMAPAAQRSSLLSKPLLERIICESLEDSASIRLVRKIRPSSSAGLFVVPAPLPAEERIASEPWSRMPRESLVASIEEMHGLYEQAASRLADHEGVKLLAQPPETMALRGLSRGEFSRDAVRLEGELDRIHREDNVSHMNKDYGALMVVDLMRAVGFRHSA